MASLKLVRKQEVGELGAAVDEERVIAMLAVEIVEVDSYRSAAEERRPMAL
jgi:hypothetical protein